MAQGETNLEPKEQFEILNNNHLGIRGVDLVDLCDKYGTPLFVIDEARLRENYRTFYDAFSKHYPKTIVCYSIKTNYNLAICKMLRQEGAYVAAASGLDLYVARKAGFPPKRVILDGLYKSEAELMEALKSNVLLINIESFSELEGLNRIAEKIGVTQDIGIRVNVTKTQVFTRKLSEAIFCYPASRFGFSLETAWLAFKRASKLKNLRVTGIMTHPYQGAADILLPYIKRIQNELGIKIQYINFGGGFAKNPTLNNFDLMMDFFRKKLGLRSKLDKRKKESVTRVCLERTSKIIAKAVKQKLGGTSEPTIIFEPGRAIVGSAGLLLLQVNCIKEAGGYKWVVVDGGTNLIPDYWERREIQIVNRETLLPLETVNLVGPLLYTHDFIAIKKRLPKIQEGDILVILDSGAYTLSQSNQFLHPRPAVVLVDLNGRLVKIREKENYEDVLWMDREV